MCSLKISWGIQNLSFRNWKKFSVYWALAHGQQHSVSDNHNFIMQIFGLLSTGAPCFLRKIFKQFCCCVSCLPFIVFHIYYILVLQLTKSFHCYITALECIESASMCNDQSVEYYCTSTTSIRLPWVGLGGCIWPRRNENCGFLQQICWNIFLIHSSAVVQAE